VQGRWRERGPALLGGGMHTGGGMSTARLLACNTTMWHAMLTLCCCCSSPRPPPPRNLPGVEVSSVERLNLLQLAPGGHLGRFVIFTKSAFDSLDKIYGEREA